jgi:ubiquitin carboxyl-terminal hydrolase 4/11/15
MKDSEGRPDEEVSKEHWEAFLARNKSIIVDLMYGQLKSTVTCQECSNISITFDPFLTLSLPIARPFKLRVYLAPYDIFEDRGSKVTKKEAKEFSIALNKNSKIEDLKTIVADLAGISKDKLLVTNFYSRSGMIETKFKDSQSC